MCDIYYYAVKDLASVSVSMWVNLSMGNLMGSFF